MLDRAPQKMLQERDARDSEKDKMIANLQAQLDYLKTKLFGSTSEIRHDQLPGQLNLFHLPAEDEPEPVPLEVEYIEVKAHKKAHKQKATYDEIFADLPTKLERIDYYATTYECPQCKETEDLQFIKDEGTPALIPGSYVSPELAANVMYDKYVMSMPLYRHEKYTSSCPVVVGRKTGFLVIPQPGQMPV